MDKETARQKKLAEIKAKQRAANAIAECMNTAVTKALLIVEVTTDPVRLN